MPRTLHLGIKRLPRMGLQFFAFGPPRLEADGEVVTGPPAQRRRIALLALLGASPNGRVTREKAIAYLWPERPSHRGRHLLSESLYVLRRLAGDDVFRRGGDDVALNPDVLWTDVSAFLTSVAEGRPLETVGLYRGVFLEGFHLDEAPEFEHWADGIRTTCARRFGQALEALAGAAEARGAALEAAEWWERLAGHEPYSSRVAIATMEALAAAGEHARALQFGGAHADRLRRDLGVEPDPAVGETLARLEDGRLAARRIPDVVRPPPALPLPDAPEDREAPVADEGATIRSASAVGERRRGGGWRGLGLGAVATVGAALGIAVIGAFSRSSGVPAMGEVRALTFEPGVELTPAFSPDGRTIAYAAGAPARIQVRQPGSRPVPLADVPEGPDQWRPSWSPDGSMIAFDSGYRIFVVPSLGGAPRQLVAHGWSPTWSPDGQRLAYAAGDTVFVLHPEDAVHEKLAVVVQPAELAWSPDGRWIALTAGNDAWNGFVHMGNLAQSRIVLVGAEDGRVVEVTDRTAMNVAPAWSPDSRRLYFVSNRTGARDIHLVELAPDGRPRNQPARLSTGLDAHGLSLSPDGERLVYSAYQGRVNLWSLPIPDGDPVGLGGAVAHTTGNQMIESISVSPDRNWLYYTSDRGGSSDLWRMPLRGGEPVQLTRDPADEFAPEQSPDGRWVAYYSMRGGSRDLWAMPTEAGEAVRLTDDPADEHAPHWSPDGSRLCYSHHSGAAGSLRLLEREGDGWSEPVVPPGEDGRPNRWLGCVGWMPDGRTLVVQDPRRTLIALLPAEGGAARTLYTADPSQGRPLPTWVRVEPGTGRIFFRDWESIWALDAETGEVRPLVRFDDPVRRATRIEMDSDGERLYFSLGDPQSDLFVVDLDPGGA